MTCCLALGSCGGDWAARPPLPTPESETRNSSCQGLSAVGGISQAEVAQELGSDRACSWDAQTCQASHALVRGRLLCERSGPRVVRPWWMRQEGASLRQLTGEVYSQEPTSMLPAIALAKALEAWMC